MLQVSPSLWARAFARHGGCYVARVMLQELVEGTHPGYRAHWEAMSDHEKRAAVQRLYDDLQGNLSPDPLIMTWLLEQAGIRLGK